MNKVGGTFQVSTAGENDTCQLVQHFIINCFNQMERKSSYLVKSLQYSLKRLSECTHSKTPKGAFIRATPVSLSGRLGQIFAAAAASGFPELQGINWRRASLRRADLSASRSACSETSFPSRNEQSAVSCPTFKRPASSCFAPRKQQGPRSGPVVQNPSRNDASDRARARQDYQLLPAGRVCSLVSVFLLFVFCLFHATQSVINNKKEGDNYKPTMCRSS